MINDKLTYFGKGYWSVTNKGLKISCKVLPQTNIPSTRVYKYLIFIFTPVCSQNFIKIGPLFCMCSYSRNNWILYEDQYGD